MDLTTTAAFTIGRALELARGGEEETAIFVLDRDWSEGLVLLQKLSDEIGIPLEENVDYIIERFCNDELGLNIGEENIGAEGSEDDDPPMEEDEAPAEEAPEPIAT